MTTETGVDDGVEYSTQDLQDRIANSPCILILIGRGSARLRVRAGGQPRLCTISDIPCSSAASEGHALLDRPQRWKNAPNASRLGEVRDNRVVLVDDNELYLESLQMDLEDRGFAVRAFPDATSLLAAFDLAAEADVLLLDWTLPSISASICCRASESAASTSRWPS